jgi:hypothetical protein
MPTLPLSRWLLLTALAVVSLASAPSRACAEDLLSFLWGGGFREVVSFNPGYPPQQIIVSFGDRKLYWIYKKGEAISYPIAIPREQSRWSGVTTARTRPCRAGSRAAIP